MMFIIMVIKPCKKVLQCLVRTAFFSKLGNIHILQFKHYAGFSFFNFWLCWVFIAVHRLSLAAVCGLLIAVASLVAEHGL